MQWLKLPTRKVEDRGFEPRSGIQVLKKPNVSFLLNRKDSICWEPPRDRKLARPETARVRISSSVSGQCHLIHHPQEIPLAQFSIYVCTKVV